MPRVSNKGVSIHYRVEGNGPPIVLGHGITDSSDVFYERGYVAALKAKYRLVLIDARGHGQSDKPHDPQSYLADVFVSDIVAVLDDLGIKTAAYWGYSMGGWAAFALAQLVPDRIACLVVGGRSATPARAYPATPGNEDPMMAALRGGPDTIVKLWGEECMTPALRKRLLASDAAALVACLQGLRLNQAFAGVLRTIAVPTFMYAGSADPVHDQARQDAAEIRGSQFVSFSGLSHPGALCRSDLVLPHVEPFLAKAMGTSPG
jgi:pimeloyl-ACP methyl ester carboxylesterase